MVWRQSSHAVETHRQSQIRRGHSIIGMSPLYMLDPSYSGFLITVSAEHGKLAPAIAMKRISYAKHQIVLRMEIQQLITHVDI